MTSYLCQAGQLKNQCGTENEGGHVQSDYKVWEVPIKLFTKTDKYISIYLIYWYYFFQLAITLLGYK